MSKKHCPIKDEKYNKLLNKLGILNLYKAWNANNKDKKEGEEWELPTEDSDIVKAVTSHRIEVGYNRDIEKPTNTEFKDGKEIDSKFYTLGDKKWLRLTNFINSFRRKQYDESEDYIQKKADELFTSREGTPITTPLPSSVTENPLNKEETKQDYINRLRANKDYAVMKGNIIHQIIDFVVKGLDSSKVQPLIANINLMVDKFNETYNGVTSEVKLKSFTWLFKTGEGKDQNRLIHLVNLFRKFNINILETDFPNGFIRDTVETEVTVLSDIGIGATLDFLAKKSYGKYVVIDWKTGARVDMDTYVNALMKYGQTKGLNIKDTARNRAKLQVAMQMILFKSKNPEAQFEAGYVGVIPNEYSASKVDKDAQVEAESFIPMIESFFKNEKGQLAQLGLPTKSYEILTKTSKDIFNPKHYSSKPLQRELLTNLLNHLMEGGTTEQYVEKLLDEIAYLTSSSKDFFNDRGVFKDDKDKVEQLMEDVMTLTQDGEFITNGAGELGFGRYILANYTDIDDKSVIWFERIRKQKELIIQGNVIKKMNRFNYLNRAVIKDYKQINSKIAVGGVLNWYDYEQIYGKMFIPVETNKSIKERLIVKSDPEYTSLVKSNPALAKLLDYVNETFQGYLVDKNSFLNQMAYEKDGTKFTHLELQGFNPLDAEGFFPKRPKTQQEFLSDFYTGRSGLGFFKDVKNWLQDKYEDTLTFFKEDTYDAYSKDIILPVKYLGNEYINTINEGRNYTHNMELIFQGFVENVERKKEMQKVYTVGKVLQYSLENKKQGNVQLYKRLSDWLSDHLTKDVLEEIIRVDVLSKPKTFNVMGKQVEVVPEKIIEGAMGWVGANTMWLKPLGAAGNYVIAKGVYEKELLKGTIATKLFGIENYNQDVTYKSAPTALKAVAEFNAAGMVGTLNEDKTFLFMKKFNMKANFRGTMLKGMLSEFAPMLKSKNLSILHELGEDAILIETFVNQLQTQKYKINGVEKSVWELYSVEKDENGEADLVWNGGIRGIIKKGINIDGVPTQQEETLEGLNANEVLKLRKVHERLQGGYGKDETLNVEVYTIGKMFPMFKKYLPRILFNIMSSKREEWSLGYYKKIGEENGKDILEWDARTVEGRWMTLGNCVLALLPNGNENYKWENLSAEQKMNLIEAAVTLLVWAGMYAAYMKLFGDDDDDSTFKKFWKRYLIDDLSQQYNPLDIAKSMSTISNPVVATRTYKLAQDLAIFMVSTMQYAIPGGEDGLIKSGLNKDEFKSLNNLLKSNRWTSIYFSFATQMNGVDFVKDKQWFSNDWMRMK